MNKSENTWYDGQPRLPQTEPAFAPGPVTICLTDIPYLADGSPRHALDLYLQSDRLA
jgi:hypothetical protein